MFSKELLQTSNYNKVITGAWTSTGQIGDSGAISIVFGNDITYGECFFCCDNSGWRYKSEDGITWTALGGYDSALYEHCRVFYLNNRFFCFMTARTLDRVHFNYTPYASVDLPDSANCTIDGACYFNNKYYIAGTQVIDQTYTGFVRNSEDLVNWSDPVYINTNNNYINSMACNDNTIVISTVGGVFSSTDGNLFTKTFTGYYRYPKVIYAKDRFILVELNTYGLRLYQSFDGYEWTTTLTSFNRFSGFKSICYGLDKLVMAANVNNSSLGSENQYNALFYESLDPNNPISVGWKTHNVSTTNGVDDIAYGNGRFVAVNGNSPYTNVCAYKLWGIE